MPRMAYADWLEATGNAQRAELIRQEYENWDIPVFENQYWEWKPLRTQARQNVDAHWLSRMHYLCLPVFRHGIPDGWRERWRLIREFTERWHNTPMPDIGGQLQEIRDTERRLGRALPPSLQEWVAFACDLWRRERAELFGHHYMMVQLPNHPAIPLLRHPAGGYQWSIRHQDLALNDPPVYGYYINCLGGSNPAAGYVQDETVPPTPLTEFILGYAIAHARGWGGFEVEVTNPGHLHQELCGRGGLSGRARVGNCEIFETEGIRVSLLSSPSRCKRMEVSVARCLPRSYVPDFLVRYGQLPAARRYGGWNYD